MKFATLLSLQRVLLVNWVAWIGLALWILARSGFANALAFVITWLILDKVWDFVTVLLIAAGKARANEQQALMMQTSGEVPALMGAAMLLDVLGTLLLPWILAAFFLGWVGAQ